MSTEECLFSSGAEVNSYFTDKTFAFPTVEETTWVFLVSEKLQHLLTSTYSEYEQHRMTIYCNIFHTCTLKHTHFILLYSGATRTLLLTGWVAHLSCFLHVVSLNYTRPLSVNHIDLNTIQESVMFQFSPTHCFHNWFSKFMHIQQNELNAYNVSTLFNGSCVKEKQVLVK